MLKDDFNNDREAAREAEILVRVTLDNLTNDYIFEDVSDDPQYYYRGDIRAIGRDGTNIYIEVKDDSRIAETRKILCEEEVYYKDSDWYGKGNMKSNYDYYCVVSQSERKIYVLDFNRLKQIYRKFGEYKEINHSNQITYCYLLDLCRARQFGALINTIQY